MWKGNGCSAVVLLLMFATQAAVSQRESLKFAENESLTGSRRALSKTAKEFFAGTKPPENLPKSALPTSIVVEQKLAQTGNTVYFVTLFDKTRTIPLYSAYKVTPSQGKAIGTHKREEVSGNWRTAPGATDVNAVYKKAINTCKTNEGFQLSRGHMNPSAINSFDINHMEATYTLSNAVPQFQMFNGLDWEKQEAKIRNYTKDTCANDGGTLYMLTGISDIGLKIPSGGGSPVQDTTSTQECPEYTFTSDGKSHKLATPRAVWSAGCCVWQNPATTAAPAKKAEWQPVTSFAVMSNNHPHQSQLHLTQMSVEKLEGLLTDKTPVNLFPGNSDCRLSIYNQML